MTRDPRAQAEAYVKSVLDSQRRHGHAKKISKEDFDAAVDRAAAGFAQLTSLPR
jgi:hypothetical protein